MAYRVNEIFKSLCGEGHHVGRVATFARFSGCNLWSGREEDRASAVCRFCDTSFVGGTRYGTGEELAAEVRRVAGGSTYVVLTGGEPTLQADGDLVLCLKRAGFQVAIETNGTRPVPPDLDWIAVSPKAGAEVVQRVGDELKVAYPQPGLDPADLGGWLFRHRFLQPMDGPDLAANTRAAIDYCLAHPAWRLSEQRHKSWGLR